MSIVVNSVLYLFITWGYLAFLIFSLNLYFSVWSEQLYIVEMNLELKNYMYMQYTYFLMLKKTYLGRYRYESLIGLHRLIDKNGAL